MRVAGGVAVGWGAVLLGWAGYNCFGQVGVATYLKGVFYYGGSSVNAETGSLNYGLLYLVAGILLLRGRNWALGVAAGVALVEGYNRVRSLVGALLDAPQREWFTGTTEGWLKLATFGIGVVVTAVLIALLGRSVWREQPGGAAAQAPPPFQSQPAAWGQPQPQPYPQPGWPQPLPGQHQPGWGQPPAPLPYPQHQQQPAQPWPGVQPQPGAPAPGPVTPGQVPTGPVAPPPADRPPQG
ncbi:hypothetical protein [Kitasatospora sp. NPDC001547]|uniref:hypothetical protein n=1 Tax=Kitasatospora sp. NPDC001547 TaxID=3364015 RepID=UPI0036BBE598|nr:hypothetical protein KitaXyl93_45620 [Kitasatospora sp. Xyl93]